MEPDGRKTDWSSRMFEQYTEKARRILFFSRTEAGELGSSAIEPEHILLGLLRVDRNLVERFCNLTPTSIEDIRSRIRASIGGGSETSDSVDMPISKMAMRVLKYAADESNRLNHRYLGSEHLLLGLLRGGRISAAELLKEHGADIEVVRNELREKTL